MRFSLSSVLDGCSRALALLALLALAAQTTGCDSNDSEDDTLNVVEVAASEGSFSTLLAALEAADLDETLRGPGPYTVFAPTDAAFAKLPEGTVETLLLPANRDLLVDVLTYHVVADEVRASEVAGLSSATMLNGDAVSIDTQNGVVLNGNARVTITDIEAENGVIHVIDTVLLPPSE